MGNVPSFVGLARSAAGETTFDITYVLSLLLDLDTICPGRWFKGNDENEHSISWKQEHARGSWETRRGGITSYPGVA